jgi:hypothetical protein
MNCTQGALRHGDLNFFSPSGAVKLGYEAPSGNRKEYTPVTDYVLAGSHGGAHILRGPALVRVVSARIIHVIVDASAIITHEDRHLNGTLAPGEYVMVRMRDADGLVTD